MQRKTALRYTVLGFIQSKPLSGYEIYKWIATLAKVLKPVGLNRIYPVLKALTDEGLVSYTVEPKDGKPDSKIYTITGAGLDVLLEWLQSPLEKDPLNNDSFILRTAFSHLLGREELLNQIREELKFRRTIRDRTVEQVRAISLEKEISEKINKEGLKLLSENLMDWSLSSQQGYIDWLNRLESSVKRRY